MASKDLEDFITFDNDNGIAYLKVAINAAWKKVSDTQYEITLKHIPLSLLRVVLEENNIDLKQAIIDNKVLYALYAEFNVDGVLFKLNKETGDLIISKK